MKQITQKVFPSKVSQIEVFFKKLNKHAVATKDGRKWTWKIMDENGKETIIPNVSSIELCNFINGIHILYKDVVVFFVYFTPKTHERKVKKIVLERK